MPGVVFFRLANTMDAMWGYKTEKFKDFGYAAAKIDDLLNWVPARITAGLYAINGRFVQAIGSWENQGSTWSSPNAGPVMAAGAGALDLELGGPARYATGVEQRPSLGYGRKAKEEDIQRAIRLVQKSSVSFVILVLIGELFFWLLNMAAIY